MKPVIPFLAMVLLGASEIAYAADPAGFRTLSARAPERGSDLTVLVWYPAGEGGKPAVIGDNPLFRGTRVKADAAPAEGRHPLVLLSHGSGGHAANLGWIASRLVAEGFVVAAPNHPGSTTGDASQASTIKIWNRPADISAVLTAVVADPAVGAGIDPDRVGVLGFSLGGYTALALAGARVDAAGYARYCESGAAGPECAWFARGGVNLRSLDAERFNRQNRDPRVRMAVSVDPAFARAYDRASLSGISVPTHIINLGRPGWIIPAVEGSALAEAIPGAEYETVPDAIHFSFLGECKPEGAAVLKAEGDEDPLCDDGGSRPRAALHAELASMIAAAFKRHLQERPGAEASGPAPESAR
ncbi:alpha/beta hydrolase family protein [Microvirga sp. GCM10011540]|uniref:alpha/beta hydrolase family protein n=1 Tax=Microvirga sp. GCM10011540 TaxID=3317338 RepID=UPI00360FE9E4